MKLDKNIKITYETLLIQLKIRILPMKNIQKFVMRYMKLQLLFQEKLIQVIKKLLKQFEKLLKKQKKLIENYKKKQENEISELQILF